MYKCHFFKELNSYLDQQLGAKDRKRIEQHLESCQACRDELARLKALGELLEKWPAPELPVNFDACVGNKIVAWELERGAVKMKKRTLAILIPTGAMAAIFVFVLVVGTMKSYLKHGLDGRFGDTSTTGTETEYVSYGGDGAAHMYLPEEKTKMAKAGHENGAWKSRDRQASNTVMRGYAKVSQQSQVPVGAYDKFDDRAEMNSAVTITSPQASGEYAQGSVIVIQPVLPATGQGEWIIRTGNVALEVENGKDAYKKAAQICQELGGYLANSNFYLDDEGRESGTITMRIPKDKFLVALDRLGTLGKVENIATNSQDVRQEYSQLKAQLDATMVVYNKMLEALQKRQVKIDEAVRLESEITPVLRKVEDLKTRIEYLSNSVSFTTVSVNFHEAKVSTKLFKESIRSFKEGLIKAGVAAIRFIAASLPVLVILGLFLAIAIVVIKVFKYWISKLFKRG